MEKIPFYKMSGSGNDFIIVDNRQKVVEEDSIEEERRLAYVGITRAQRTLSITMARWRKRYGEKMICEPSRFLEELPEDDIEWQGGERATKTTPEKGRSHLAGLKELLS